MSSKLLLLTFFCLLIGFSACNDDEDEITRKPRIKMMSIYENDLLISQQSFEYDLSEWLIKRSYGNGDWISYTYTPDSIIEETFYHQSQDTINDIILLNAKGLAVSKDHGTSTMEYDPDGYLIKKNNLTGERYSFLYNIENGNMTVGSMLSENNYLTTRVMQTNVFLPNSTNTIGDENKGITFLGKQNKELISTIQYSQGPLLTFTYEYYSEDRVSKITGSNGRSVTYTYY